MFLICNLEQKADYDIEVMFQKVYLKDTKCSYIKKFFAES